MVCDKVMRERWCVTKMVRDKDVCDKDVWKMVCERWCVTKMVCDKVVCERWCVTKMVCDKVVCDKVVCERWCVTKLCVKDGVWQSCVWKMVCDKVVCERWCVTKMVCDKDVCERWCGSRDTESKTRTPHQDVAKNTTPSEVKGSLRAPDHLEHQRIIPVGWGAG